MRIKRRTTYDRDVADGANNIKKERESPRVAPEH